MTDIDAATKEECQYIRMTETPVLRLVASLSVPTVASMLVTSIYNLADTYFVSQLGTNASAAVGVVFSLQSLIQSVGFGFGMGAGAIVSQKLGAKKNDEASVYVSSAFAAAIFFGVVLAATCLFSLENSMLLFGSNEEILPYACAYGRYILYGAPLMCSTYVLNIVLRASGKARLSMIGILTGAVLNIILDPLFIFDQGFGLGTAGAAIATLISQTISFSILLSFYVLRISIIPLSAKKVSRCSAVYMDIISTGMPTVCRQGIASLATILLNHQAKMYGSAAVAAMSIANRVYMFMRSIIVGIGQGFQPVAGYNYGAKKYDRVKSAFKATVIIGSTVAVVATAVVALFSPNIMNCFIDSDTIVTSIGVDALNYLCLSLPWLAYSTYVNQMLQCLSCVRSATFLALCRNGTFYVPLIFILPKLLGLTGIELTQPFADILTVLISIPFQISFFNKLPDNTASKSNRNN